MLVDYHLHTNRCGHATGEMEEYVLAALRLGVEEIGFADHAPQYFLSPKDCPPGIAMQTEELPGYVEELKALRTKYPQLNIKLGIEADYIPGKERALDLLLKSHPFDYVLGSIHYLDGWGFDNPEYRGEYTEFDPDELYEKYFRLLQAAAKAGIFDVLAHPDLIKKFNFQPTRSLDSLYQKTAAIIADSQVCVEVSTAGLRVPVQEIYPHPQLLRYLFAANVPITLGSDAHAPEEVAFAFHEALSLIKETGYTKIAIFNQRRRSFVNIS